MKKHVFKSFALITMLFSAMTLSAASGVDWSTIEWIGSTDANFSNKFKCSTKEGLVNIQKPFGDEMGIYMTFPTDVDLTCNLSGFYKQGAGLLLYLSSFTAQETEVNVTYATGSCTFWVYYADGTADGEEGSDTEAPVLESVELFGAAQNFVLLTPNATDNRGVMSYLLTPNGGAEKEVALDDAGKIKIEGLTLDKTYTYSIKAKDAAGNVSAVREITFSTLDRVFCEEEILPNVQFVKNQKLIFTAKKVSDTETYFALTSPTSTLTSMFNVNTTNKGGGTLPADYVEKDGWTLTGNTLSKTVTWATYPTSPITIAITANRTHGAGEKNLIGLSYSMDISNTCGDGSGDSGDSGDSGESNEPVYPTPPASSGIDWSTTYNWVEHQHYSSYANQYKVETGCVKESPIQIQENSGIGIYMTFAMAIKSCSINESKFEGSGLLLYLSALTAEETYVTVIFHDDTQCSFWVYNAKETTSSSTTIDWEDISTWLNHNGFTDYENQFKSNSTCCEVCYIQDYNGEKCIYVRFPREITTCNIPHYKDGGQLYIPLTSLEAIETPITVKMVTGEICSFYLYNAEGTANPTIVPGVCVYEGGAGDGLSSPPGRNLFEKGYEVSLQLDATQANILVTAITNDGEATKAVFQNYYTYIEKEANNERYMDGQDTDEFTLTVPVSWVTNNEDGIIRFAIKFEYPNGVIKVTTPEYFYLDGSGCAQRVFAIYHHDDLPATPLEGEDQFTEFAGGRILQSIQYKRRMPSEVWETLSVPFEVDRVTAFDPATGEHVPLHAQYSTSGTITSGNYWLRYFKTEEVTASNFQPNWYDIEAPSQEAAKPEKDKAYIIRLPNGGGYYNDKYIVFHGKGYQTIASEYDIPTAPADNYFSYSGNNTMMPQPLKSAYVLDNAGYYFTSSSTVTLPPFECSVNATAATIAKMPRIALNGRNNTTTDLTLLPTTDLQGGVIYSIFGAAVARFNTIDEYDQACQTLAAGVYVVVTPSATTKIQIP